MSPLDFSPAWIWGSIRTFLLSFNRDYMCGILSKMNKVAILITTEKNPARNPWNKGNTRTYGVKNLREDVSVQKNHNFSWWGTLKPENILKVQCLCEKFTILPHNQAGGRPQSHTSSTGHILQKCCLLAPRYLCFSKQICNQYLCKDNPLLNNKNIHTVLYIAYYNVYI